jgi:hypothetical protein
LSVPRNPETNFSEEKKEETKSAEPTSQKVISSIKKIGRRVVALNDESDTQNSENLLSLERWLNGIFSEKATSKKIYDKVVSMRKDLTPTTFFYQEKKGISIKQDFCSDGTVFVIKITF